MFHKHIRFQAIKMKYLSLLLFSGFSFFVYGQFPYEQYFGSSGFDAPAATVLNNKVFFHAIAHNKKEDAYFFKTNLLGQKDSVKDIDLGEPFSYGFLYAGTYNNQLIWLGSYDSIGIGFYNVLGPAILLTDTNFNIIDRYVQYKPRWQITSMVVEGNTLIATADTIYPLSSSRALVFDLSLNKLQLALDTALTLLSPNIKNTLTLDTTAYFFHGRNGYHTLNLSNFAINSEVPVFQTPLNTSKFSHYNSTKVLKQDSIIKANAINFWFSTHRSDLSLIDTFSFTSNNQPPMFFPNCDVVVDGHYYFGGSYPWSNVLTGPAFETPFVICKLSGKNIAWERNFHEPNVYKELRYLLGSTSQDQIFALYINYDMRVANPKLSIAITILDTAGSVLSTQTIWQAPTSNIHLFPNPASDWFAVNSDDRQEQFNISIHNSKGQFICAFNQVYAHSPIPTKDLAPGAYYVSIQKLQTSLPPIVCRLIVR